MSAHLAMLPIVLPLALGAALLVAHRAPLGLRRTLNLASCLALLALAAALAVRADGMPPAVYPLGNWPAPWGIVLVADRLSAMLLLLSAVLGVAGALHAAQGWDERGPHFHALWQFQLMGLNGAFLTGDLFNLFVFFEVLLIASYALLLHGSGAPRLRAALPYVLINLAGSALFLVAASLLYGAAGTLNMADLARAAAHAPAGDAFLLQSAGLLLAAVFGVKAALVPLHFWLPAAYPEASAPVAALFAVMTKVGAYCLIRLAALAPEGGLSGGLLVAALLTLGVAALAMLAARTLRELAAWAVVGSAGTVLLGPALGGAQALSGALLYLAHSTLFGAALFLLAEFVMTARPQLGDRLEHGPPVPRPLLAGGLFLLCAAAVTGLPPFAGFLGKALLLAGALQHAHWAWVWAAVLGASALGLLAWSRAGAALFWNTGKAPAARVRPLATVAGLALAGVALAALAGPLSRYTGDAAREMAAPEGYVRAVLGAGGTP